MLTDQDSTENLAVVANLKNALDKIKKNSDI